MKKHFFDVKKIIGAESKMITYEKKIGMPMLGSKNTIKGMNISKSLNTRMRFK